MPIKFLARLIKGAGHYHIFYVPKDVKEFYGLKSGSYLGGVTLKNGTATSHRIELSPYKNTLKGRVPDSVGYSKSIVEIWMYPHTRIHLDKTDISTMYQLSRGMSDEKTSVY